MLATRVRIVQNPWDHRVPTNKLAQILTKIAESCAKRIERNLPQPEDAEEEPSFALVILDSTAPHWKPSAETILAIIEVGFNTEPLVVNAIAKAIWHRDHGQMAGYGVYVDTLTSADGDFAWGYSSQVDNTIGGGGGLTQEQDAYLVGTALVTYNYLIRLSHKEWFEAQDPRRPSWFCNTNQAGQLYASLAANDGAVFDSYA